MPRRHLFSQDPPRICSIAGSDSGGGAGIQADIKTILSLGGYAMSAVTALTAQSTQGVQGIHDVPAEFVKQQLQTLQADVEIDAFKIGMLARADIVVAVAEHLSSIKGSKSKVVLDPVMISTSGSLLLQKSAVEHLIHQLLPQCDLLTPNLPEARTILLAAAGQPLDQATADQSSSTDTESKDVQFKTVHDLIQAAKSILDLGPAAVLVKGGHMQLSRDVAMEAIQNLLGPSSEADSEPATPAFVGQGCRWKTNRQGDISVVLTEERPWSNLLRKRFASQGNDDRKVVVDVLCERDTAKGRKTTTLFVKPHLDATSTHGTGCTLSSAITTHLGAGESSQRATLLGIEYVQASIARGISDLGKGAGPLNHASGIQRRAVPMRCRNPGMPSEQTPLLICLLGACADDWERFTKGPFVEQVIDGSLPDEAFIYFLQQDYCFLRQYAQVWSLAASKAKTFKDIKLFAAMASSMAEEAELHEKLCAQWGIGESQLQQTVESAATLAYTRFAIDVAHRGDLLEVLTVTMPCMLGYAEMGDYASRKKGDRSNQYDEWIATYASPEFQQAAFSAVGE